MISLATLAAVLVLAGCGGAPATSPQPSPLASPTQVAGLGHVSVRLTAGPTCPVETVPPDPACAPQPVEGALVVVLDAGGNDVGQATSDADGRLVLELPAGGYVVAPQPVDGLMGTPEGQSVFVRAGETAELEFGYDTGIR